jgi:bacterioferritin
MKGEPKVIELLNEALAAEMTAVNQYFINGKMCADWGFNKLAAKAREESIEEMRHAEVLIERILFLDGMPNMDRHKKVVVGRTVRAQLEQDLKEEIAACELYNRGMRVSREADDNGSADLFERLLKDEEGHIDWLEAQLTLMDQIGEQNYLAQQVGE